MSRQPAPPGGTIVSPKAPVGPGGTAPLLRLPHILNYLRDQDAYRDPQWNTKFSSIEKYLDEAQQGRLRGDLSYGFASVLAALDEARSMVEVHRKYQKWNTDRTRWSTDVLPGKLFSDRLVTYPKVHPRPSPGNDRSLIQHKFFDIPPLPVGRGPFYTPAPQLPGRTQEVADNELSKFLRKDQAQFWDTLDGHVRAKTNVTATVWNPPQGNLYNTSNQMYEQCITGGIAETNIRIKMESMPPTATPAGGQNGKFARERGLKRAAIQQCLNLFTNHENRVVNTPWRRVVLPYDTVTLPKEVPFQPRVVEPDRIPHLGKEPFPWVYWYNGHKSYLNLVAAKKRAAYNTSKWGERHRPCLPINFCGPYTFEGVSAHDEHWLKAGKYLTQLEAHLRDRYSIYPRPLLRAILSDIDAGKLYPHHPEPNSKNGAEHEARVADFFKRRDLYMREEVDDDMSGGEPVYKLLSEWEITWLKFVGEPPRSLLMMDKVDELRQDNLALIFDNRLQEILRAYGSWEETTEDPIGEVALPLPVDELLDKINGTETEMLPDDHLRQPNEAYQFTIEEVEHYIKVLARLGRCRFFPAGKKTRSSVAPADFDLFPEDRILWPARDDKDFLENDLNNKTYYLEHLLKSYPDKGNGDKAGHPDDYRGILDHRELPDNENLPDTLAGHPGVHNNEKTNVLLELWVPEKHYARHDIDADNLANQPPSFKDLASWDVLAHWVRSGEYSETAEKTCQFLRGLAFRMGTTIQYYRNLQSQLQKWQPLNRNDSVRELDYWTAMVEQGEDFVNKAPKGDLVTTHLDTPSVQAVVDKADPDKALASMTEDKDPFVLIRKGLINDCVENRNMLYPGRLAAFSDMSQKPFQGLQRPNLFCWATSAQRRYQAPYTRRAFFHMRRWPLHHQSTERQGWLQNREDELLRIDPRIEKDGILTTRIEPSAMFRPGPSPAGLGPTPEEAIVFMKANLAFLPPRKGGGYDPYASLRPDPLAGYSGAHLRKVNSDSSRRPTPGHGNTGGNNTGGSGGGGGGGGGLPGLPGPPSYPLGARVRRNLGPKPMTRPGEEFIPGPALFPMGETEFQRLVVSQQLENSIYPYHLMPWSDWAKKKVNDVIYKPQVHIPLLPAAAKASVVRSNPFKRKLPTDFVKEGSHKRVHPPGPPDNRPDSGHPLSTNFRVFRRPGKALQGPRQVSSRKDHTARLRRSMPRGWRRMPTSKTTPVTGLARAVEAVTNSITTQLPNVTGTATLHSTLQTSFTQLPTQQPNWLEIRRHNGKEDPTYAGPTFGDQMAGALYYFGQTQSLDIALGVIDTRTPNMPFVYPLPEGHNGSPLVVWIHYDGQAARWRRTPPRRDQAWQMGDFNFWLGVQPNTGTLVPAGTEATAAMTTT